MSDFMKGTIYGIIAVTLVDAYGKYMYNQGVEKMHKLDRTIFDAQEATIDMYKSMLEKKGEES